MARSYSSFSNKPEGENNTKNLKPIKIYNNLKEDRFNILKQQRDKSGVYCLINKINGHSYPFLFRDRFKYMNDFNLLSRFYSTQKAKTNSLDPWFVTGFCDGESNFLVSITSRAESKLKCRVRVRFQIFVSIKEMPLLLEMQNFFGGIGIVNTESNRAFYSVDQISDILKVIIPHFIAYPLITQKRKDFILWSKIAEMMDRKEHLTIKGLDLILKMKPFINKGFNEKAKDLLKELNYLFTEFEHVMVNTSDLDFKITSIPSPYWIVGFVAAEGSFSASPYSIKLKAYRARFFITQDKRDLPLLELITSYLGTGNLYKSGYCFNYEVSSYKKNYEIILPFFIKYPLPSMCLKATNFLIWKQILEIMHSGLHKTSSEHRSKLDKLISTINN